MCHRVACPNDGRPTWWGCGHHIDTALAGVPEAERCTCPHERVPYLPLMQRVRKLDVWTAASDDARVAIRALPTGETVEGNGNGIGNGDGAALRLLLSATPGTAKDKENGCVTLEIALPPTLAATRLPPGVAANGTNTLGATLGPSATASLEIPLRLAETADSGDDTAKLAIFGPGAGSVRRQWVPCGDKAAATDLQDIHASLAVPFSAASGDAAGPAEESGFGLGGGISPTHAVAALLILWVLYSVLFGSEKAKRE